METGVGGGKLQSYGGEHSNRGAEGKVRDSRTEDQCRPALTSLRGLSAGCELKLGLRRSDPRERTGVGYMNTA